MEVLEDLNVGIFPEMEYEDYKLREGLNQSSLKQILVSPAHYHHQIFIERAETKAMQAGTAIHMAILEPARFESEYLVLKKPDGAIETVEDIKAALKTAGAPTTGRKEELVLRLAEVAPEIIFWPAEAERLAKEGKRLVTEEQMRTFRGVANAVRAHPAAKRLLRICSTEVSLFWDMEGERCKARVDGMTPHCIFDLKKTQDASASEFAKTCAKYGYAFQAAFYRAGYRELTGDDIPFVFIAVEEAAPHGVAVYEPDEDFLEFGEVQFKRAIETLQRCRETQRFPGYQSDGLIEKLSLPKWAKF